MTWTGEEVAIPVKCNIHPWMHGYMAVVKGPYAVSDDSGSFTLNLPPGSYTVTAWQEELRNSDAEGDGGCRQAGDCGFHL